MRNLNVTGRLAADAEVKTTKNGKQFIEFRMANNEYSRNASDGDGSKTVTYWFRVTSFNENHLKLVQFLKKGHSIAVVGKLEVSPYVSNTTNKPEAGLEVLAYDIQFDPNFSSPKTDGENTQTTVAATTAQQAESAPAKPKATRNPTTTPIKPKQQKPVEQPQEEDTDDLPF